MIEIQEINIESLELKVNQFNSFITPILISEKKIEGDIVLIFCSDEYLLEINKKHLNHDYYTDIITFDYCAENIVSGDLYISVDRIKENAKTFEDTFINELTRVVIHGVLHLCGHNDKTEADQKNMRNLENKYLAINK
jgi:rRNA maturation RNase YbeY